MPGYFWQGYQGQFPNTIVWGQTSVANSADQESWALPAPGLSRVVNVYPQNDARVTPASIVCLTAVPTPPYVGQITMVFPASVVARTVVSAAVGNPTRPALVTATLGSPATGAPFATSGHPSGRYFVDQYGQPFLLVGDSAWAVFTNVPPTSGDNKNHNYYLSTRAAQGINTIMLGLLTDDYISNWDGSNPNNLKLYDGTAPFFKADGVTPGVGFPSGTGSPTDYDITKPNPAYFNKLDTFVNLAASYGLTVMFVPNESGSPSFSGCGKVMTDNGPAAARTWGQFLGNHYKNFPNVMWLHGNDYGGDGSNTTATWAAGDPVFLNVAKGIRDTSHQIQSVELNFLISTSNDDAAWSPWIDYNADYTYYSTYQNSLNCYANSYPKPVFFVEGNYENSSLSSGVTGVFSGASPANQRLMLRRQMWYAATCGCCGQLYGNEWVFPFGRAFPSLNWDTFLVTVPTAQLGYQTTMLKSLPWWTLVPDPARVFVTTNFGVDSSDPLATTVSTGCIDSVTNGVATTGLVYVAAGIAPTINLALFRGTTLVRWFDPVNGTFIPVGSFANSGTLKVSVPLTCHLDGTNDWVLVVTA